ncbi:hypothetical protein Y032_0032g2494 [Ancylostoma ceylanicum]|uniref:VWFA domain-containing protein n=1 Tax=Ancylostoma ceylanicum TaxID=53326 RepID=A0A016UNM1_9BILA|nr:hypothetical protein Y032_0032g2494 [Ancylostoma ceylanicum]
MVFDASLGYDPDEWEECPPKEQFMVFSFFTRLLLSSAAVAFVVFFFRMIETNKEKDGKKDEPQRGTADDTIKQASRKLEEYVKLGKETVKEADHALRNTADDLLREADEYMSDMAHKTKEGINEVAKEVKRHLPHEIFSLFLYAKRKFTELHVDGGQPQETFAQFIEEPRRRAEDAERRLQEQAHAGAAYLSEQAQNAAAYAQDAAQRFNEKLPPLDQRGYQPAGVINQFNQQKMPSPPLRKISREDEEALRLWELERERLEAERLAKLQDREVGGEESELTSTGMLPASHISYPSRSTQEGELSGNRRPPNAFPAPNQRNGLERKLLTEIGQIAEASPAVKRESYRDSDLTDYDISDFHGTEHGFDNYGTAPAADVHFVQGGQHPRAAPTVPAPIGSIDRNTTGDSDDYVKVHADPIYDMPPRNEKAMSPEEAKQLQDLYKEYDFGIDIGPEGQAAQQFPTSTQFSPPVVVHPRDAQQGAPSPSARELLDEAERNVHRVHIKLLPQSQKELIDGGTFAFGGPEQVPPPGQAFHIADDGREDPKNVVNAEMYVSDALEYLGNQEESPAPAGAFVIEEEMLSSQGSLRRPEQQVRLPSGDPTSHQVKTMEVFERVEHDEHDDITYAPEIQSVEIPPDQMSENSENLQEYFDRAAAEGALEANRLRDMKPITAQQAAMAKAPHIASATARAQSASSLASGRSARSSSDGYPKLRKQSSLLSVMGVTSMQEILLTINSLDSLSDAMRRAGLENTNMIFGIDYTASNKYQGEDSFGGRSLHTIHPNVKNPYQQVITILGRTLAPFASTGRIPVYGFGDAKTGDWSVFPLKPDGDCTTLEEVLKVYNEVTPTVDLSGPTNFAPLIYQAMEICQSSNDYHILVIIADGQVTNERATRRAIVQACQYPLSIIVVGVGDGPWEMMKVFDESLPKRPWDNFHFVEFHEIMRRTIGQSEGDVKLAVQSLLEIPDQYRCICELGLLKNRSIPPRGSEIRKDMAR